MPGQASTQEESRLNQKPVKAQEPLPNYFDFAEQLDAFKQRYFAPKKIRVKREKEEWTLGGKSLAKWIEEYHAQERLEASNEVSDKKRKQKKSKREKALGWSIEEKGKLCYLLAWQVLEAKGSQEVREETEQHIELLTKLSKELKGIQPARDWWVTDKLCPLVDKLLSTSSLASSYPGGLTAHLLQVLDETLEEDYGNQYSGVGWLEYKAHKKQLDYTERDNHKLNGKPIKEIRKEIAAYDRRAKWFLIGGIVKGISRLFGSYEKKRAMLLYYDTKRFLYNVKEKPAAIKENNRLETERKKLIRQAKRLSSRSRLAKPITDILSALEELPLEQYIHTPSINSQNAEEQTQPSNSLESSVTQSPVSSSTQSQNQGELKAQETNLDIAFKDPRRRLEVAMVNLEIPCYEYVVRSYRLLEKYLAKMQVLRPSEFKGYSSLSEEITAEEGLKACEEFKNKYGQVLSEWQKKVLADSVLAKEYEEVQKLYKKAFFLVHPDKWKPEEKLAGYKEVIGQYKSILLLEEKEEEPIKVEPYRLIVQKKAGSLIVYWNEWGKVQKKAIAVEVEEIADIIKQLPKENEETEDKDLVRAILLKYDCLEVEALREVLQPEVGGTGDILDNYRSALATKMLEIANRHSEIQLTEERIRELGNQEVPLLLVSNVLKPESFKKTQLAAKENGDTVSRILESCYKIKENWYKVEEEARRKEDAQRQEEEERSKKEEERRQKEEERRQKEEERKLRQEAEKKAEEERKLRQEAEKEAEEARKLRQEAEKKAEEERRQKEEASANLAKTEQENQLLKELWAKVQAEKGVGNQQEGLQEQLLLDSSHGSNRNSTDSISSLDSTGESSISIGSPGEPTSLESSDSDDLSDEDSKSKESESENHRRDSLEKEEESSSLSQEEAKEGYFSFKPAFKQESVNINNKSITVESKVNEEGSEEVRVAFSVPITDKAAIEELKRRAELLPKIYGDIKEGSKQYHISVLLCFPKLAKDELEALIKIAEQAIANLKKAPIKAILKSNETFEVRQDKDYCTPVVIVECPQLKELHEVILSQLPSGLRYERNYTGKEYNPHITLTTARIRTQDASEFKNDETIQAVSFQINKIEFTHKNSWGAFVKLVPEDVTLLYHYATKKELLTDPNSTQPIMPITTSVEEVRSCSLM